MAACISEPDVAVTVTIDVVDVPPVVGSAVEKLLLQPVSKVTATTIDGNSNSIQCRTRRFLLLTAKPSTAAGEEPENEALLGQSAAARTGNTASAANSLSTHGERLRAGLLSGVRVPGCGRALFDWVVSNNLRTLIRGPRS